MKEAIGGYAADGARGDVVRAPPMQMVTITFDADNPGTFPDLDSDPFRLRRNRHF